MQRIAICAEQPVVCHQFELELFEGEEFFRDLGGSLANLLRQLFRFVLYRQFGQFRSASA
jgi:hypothetical protein